MTPITDWFVVFTDTPQGGWWTRFLKPGFRHVAVFGKLPDGRWVNVDSTFWGLHVYLLSDEDVSAVYTKLSREHKARGFHHRAAGVPMPTGFPLFPLTCASVVAHLLGVKPWRALTPHMLYRTLMGG